MKKEKRRIGKGILLLLSQHLAAVVAAVCVAAVLGNIFFQVSGITRRVNRYALYPWDEQEEYERSEVFQSAFQMSVDDIITMAVIRTQMETNDAFDGKKKVDIAAYVNRKNTDKQESVSAEYYLEDLIKWSEYGFTYEDMPAAFTEGAGNPEEAFMRYRTGQILGGKKNVRGQKEEIVSETAESTAQEPEFAVTVSDEAEAIEAEAADGEILFVTEATEEEMSVAENSEQEEMQIPILNERYKTVDGSSILSYVSSLEEYNEFVSTLRSASDQLAYNYRTYKQFRGSFDSDRSNIRYCLMIPAENGYRYFCNVKELEEELEAADTEDIMQVFRGFGVYLYYYPKHLEYETNLEEISEDMVRNSLNSYSYVYPEESRIWIGVDTSYPADDGLRSGKQQYDRFMPYYGFWVFGAAAAVIIWLILLLAITVKIARDKEVTLKLSDYIPAEIMVVLAGAISFIYGLVACSIWFTLVGYAESQNILFWLLPVLAVILSMVFMFFFLSLIRRIKAHVFWKHTVIGWLLKKCMQFFKMLWKKMKRVADELYNDKSLVVRTWGPYTFFLLVNLFSIALFFTKWWVLGVILAGVFDLAVGVLQFQWSRMRQRIIDGIETIRDGNIAYQVDTEDMHGDNLALARAVNNIGDGIRAAVETSMKDERLKADLITNVSHDIKTPLTSIINYVDLIKREDVQNERVKGYIEVLDAKSQRLKQLTEDLVEASKISSGNIVYQFERINFVELIHQTLGEFSEKFEEKQLTMISMLPEESVPIEADSRRIWRVIENLYNNIYKYAMPGTRVYLDMIRQKEGEQELVILSIKNISAQPLNINADELTERFIRGDVSRSTEGSGLGLSIAKSLTEAQHGSFTIYLDGDLFKVILKFPVCVKGTLQKSPVEGEEKKN